MASRAFQKALTFTLRWEGGYSDRANDRGGKTNYGITQSTYDGYRNFHKLPKKPVREINRAEAEEIYYRNFWLKASCDSFHPAVACCIFDFIVNSGFSNQWDTGGMQIIQREFDLQDDGKCGPKTITAVNVVPPEEACRRINDAREENYRRLSKGKGQLAHLRGWLNRLADLRSSVQKSFNL